MCETAVGHLDNYDGDDKDDTWLPVFGGEEALGRSLQAAIIDRASGRAPPQLQVCESSIIGGGHGLFARRNFAQGELVLELYGALVPRGKEHERAEARDYLFGLNAFFQVDPIHPDVQSEWRIAWAINHSCDPNLVALKSNYQRLGFSSKEAAYIRQPLAMSSQEEGLQRPVPARERESGTDRQSAHKTNVLEAGRYCKRQRKTVHPPEKEGPGDEDSPADAISSAAAGPGPARAMQESDKQGIKKETKGSAVAQQEALLESHANEMNDIIFFLAIKPIKVGEEVFFDYRRGAARPGPTDHLTGSGKTCHCLSSQCRGVF